MMTDHQIIFLKLWVNKISGTFVVRSSMRNGKYYTYMRDMIRMVSAMNIIRIYSNKATGIR